MLRFSIVIVTYNRLNLLKECLSQVEKQVKKFDEIIVVNNCSTDRTKDFLDEYNNMYHRIRVFHTKKNLGGAAGFRLGAEKVLKTSDYVLFIDDDVMLDKYFLNNICASMEDDIYAYSGTVYTNGKIDQSHRRRIKDAIFLSKEDVALSEYKKYSFEYNLSTFCGLLVSTKIIAQIGLPLGEYFIWYDDTEFSLRLNKYTKIKNINNALLNHKTQVDSENRLTWKSYYGYRNSIDMGRRHSKIPLLYVIYRYLYHIYRMLYFTVKSLSNTQLKEYYQNCMILHRDVIVDSSKHTLGKNKKYYPGRKI